MRCAPPQVPFVVPQLRYALAQVPCTSLAVENFIPAVPCTASRMHFSVPQVPYPRAPVPCTGLAVENSIPPVPASVAQMPFLGSCMTCSISQVPARHLTSTLDDVV